MVSKSKKKKAHVSNKNKISSYLLYLPNEQ